MLIAFSYQLVLYAAITHTLSLAGPDQRTKLIGRLEAATFLFIKLIGLNQCSFAAKRLTKPFVSLDLLKTSSTMTGIIDARWVLACLIGLAVGHDVSKSIDSAGGGNSTHGGKHLVSSPPPISPATMAAKAAAELLNTRYAHDILIILTAAVVALGLYRITIVSVRYIRALTCLNNNTQRYFKAPPPTFATVKRHLLYAPLLRSRHSREFRLFSLNLGILPTRLQSIFLLGIVAMNVLFCTYRIPWHESQTALLAQLGDRTGVLSVVNMIPLVIMAGRNNVLIVCLNLSFDTFNLVHRFFGRVVIVEALIHSIAHIVKMVDGGLYAAVPLLSMLTVNSWVGRLCQNSWEEPNDPYRLHREQVFLLLINGAHRRFRAPLQ